jgi:hypothetical protein
MIDLSQWTLVHVPKQLGIIKVGNYWVKDSDHVAGIEMKTLNDHVVVGVFDWEYFGILWKDGRIGYPPIEEDLSLDPYEFRAGPIGIRIKHIETGATVEHRRWPE